MTHGTINVKLIILEIPMRNKIRKDTQLKRTTVLGLLHRYVNNYLDNLLLCRFTVRGIRTGKRDKRLTIEYL